MTKGNKRCGVGIYSSWGGCSTGVIYCYEWIGR
jgi:hypothetical protein